MNTPKPLHRLYLLASFEALPPLFLHATCVFVIACQKGLSSSSKAEMGVYVCLIFCFASCLPKKTSSAFRDLQGTWKRRNSRALLSWRASQRSKHSYARVKAYTAMGGAHRGFLTARVGRRQPQRLGCKCSLSLRIGEKVRGARIPSTALAARTDNGREGNSRCLWR